MLSKKGLMTSPSAVALYVEDVFSTYLYTGNGSTQTITNDIDLSGEGGLVWFKIRNDIDSHWLYDTARGVGYTLETNSTNQSRALDGLTSFNANGFSITESSTQINTSNDTYASWTFRKAEKFFDVVTYTGNGTARTINHNLGSVPGCIIVKRTDSSSAWYVKHSGLSSNSRYMVLNTTAAEALDSTIWDGTAPTSTVFSIGTSSNVNTNGASYVAYLFASDAGGFGDDGDQSVIKCGSYSGSSGDQTITLGWEPQWVMIKSRSRSDVGWIMFDNMRGVVTGDNDAYLYANLSNAEASSTDFIEFSATGFLLKAPSGATDITNSSGETYIYIAIRRGPMKTPESGTEVFGVQNNASTSFKDFGFPVDWSIFSNSLSTAFNGYNQSRLTDTKYLVTSSTAAEASTSFRFQSNTGVFDPGTYNLSFRRAPGFFDVVCYTGTGSNTTVSHNLGVAPEMMIVKRRSNADNWFVYSQTLGNTKHIALDGSGGASGNNIAYWNNTSPTASVFSLGTDTAVNASGSTYVAYLFASVTGVSKVGSYTGTGTTLQINCGFTGGARFVLIKRTDSTGDWYVWDTARGIVSGNDPYLLLNSTAAEVTNTDYIDTYSSGFEISSTAPAAINANGGTFIYLAIA